MRIKYNVRSGGFRDQAESVLKDRGDSLDAGDPVVVDFGGDYEYREDEFLLSVSADDHEDFVTDWWKGRADLFPARAKAVATALRDLKYFGSYRFRNLKEGLEIAKRGETELPYRSFSWDIVSKKVADKKLDRSAFMHRGTGIPAEIAWFFGIGEEGPASLDHTLTYKGRNYSARTPLDNHGRYRLFWNSDFTEVLKSALPTFSEIYERNDTPNQDCWMRFVKTSESNYEIKLCTEKGDDKVKGAKPKDKDGRVPDTGYWTFISNPAVWSDVYEVIATKEEFNHQVRDSDVENFGEGQLGVMRVGIDWRTKAQRDDKPKREPGVYAIVEITSDPYLRPLETIPNLAQTEEKQKRTHIVDFRILKKLEEKPLTIDFLKSQPGVTDKYLLDGFQGSSIPLDKESFDLLEQLADAEADLDLGLEKTVSKTPKRDLHKKFRKASPKMVEIISKRYERGSEGELVKRKAERKCQISEAMGLDPYSFKKKNGENYCEAHHVVPVSSGEEGSRHPSNVICVSADRHRQLHYGNTEVVDIRDDEFEFLIDGETVIVPKLIPGD